MMNRITVLGICAGNGVCLLPFQRLGRYKILGNIEPRSVFYDKANYQWSLNFPAIPQMRGHRDYFNLERSKFSPHIIIGHPDCGHASILRLSRAKKNVTAKGNLSLCVYIDGVNLYKPEIFLMENLPGLLNTYSKEDFKKIFPNYHLIFHISSVMAYGNSQKSRNRLVIIGIRKITIFNWSKLFRLPDYSNRARTAEHFDIHGKENAHFGHVREPLNKFTNLIWGSVKKITYKKAKYLWQNNYYKLTKWPVGGKMKNQPGVNRMLPGQYPFTVRKQNRQFGIHGDVLSPREMATIQGIPFSFQIRIKTELPEKELVYWLNKWRTTVTKTMPYDIAMWFAKKCLRALDT